MTRPRTAQFINRRRLDPANAGQGPRIQRLTIITPTNNSTDLLREILSQRPKIHLHEIRRTHPIFQTMSIDHLGLRVAQVAQSLAPFTTGSA